MKYRILCLFFMSVLVQGKAQTSANEESTDNRLDSLESEAKTHAFIEINGSYVSSVAYYGRTEGINQYGLSPMITGHLGKGWSLSYGGNIWSAAQPRYAFSTIGINKDFNMGASGEGTIGYSRWLSHTSDPSQKSDYTGSIDLDTHWNIGDFTLGNYASVLLGGSSAFFLEPSIDYQISNRFGRQRLFTWTINPSITATLGNDVVTRVAIKKLKNINKLRGKTTFGLLNYDAAVDATLTYRHTDLSFGYHYNIPQHTVAPNPTSPFSYVEISLSQWFGL